MFLLLVMVLLLGCNLCKGRKFYSSQHLVNPQYIFVKCLNKTSSTYFVISFRNCDAQPFFFLSFSFSLDSYLGGIASPDESWKGGLNVSYNIGPGFVGHDSFR